MLCLHKERAFYKLFISYVLFVLFVLTTVETTLASFVIQSQDTVNIELKGYSGLTDATLFKGSLHAGAKHTVDTPYRGLALLIFEKGQRYPVILGEQSFLLTIKNPDSLPSFTGSVENEFLYNSLTGAEQGQKQYDFPLLMIEAKQLLNSSHSIRTVDELAAMKEKFHIFTSTHYQQLQYSDMLMRLIGQYFMMHEYVNFHIEGTPASDIQVRYKKAVINGVGNWLELLKVNIPEHDVLNYCVSLYYNRSMVSLAHLIVSNFRDIAYCPGNIEKSIRLSKDLSITDADGNRKGILNDFGNSAVISFVSDDCPVSMVETVVRARQLAAQEKDAKLIVAPLQELSNKHLAMRRMLSSANMLFVNDEKWYKNSLPKDVRLPLFVNIAKSAR